VLLLFSSDSVRFEWRLALRTCRALIFPEKDFRVWFWKHSFVCLGHRSVVGQSVLLLHRNFFL
jgi:hypothetical protein